MKKPLKPFTVAHKRRLRNVAAEPASIWSGKTGREMRSLLNEGSASEPDIGSSLEGVMASFQPNQVLKSIRSTGRILESRTEAKAVAANATVETQLAEHETAIETLTTVVIEELVPEDYAEITVAVEALKPSSVSLSQKPSIRERRRAIRKALPLGERWKRHLPY
ncbi:hypothetical protein [Aureimonas altamirensis]|uniref:hypothetical protein n=1 Tax=Aureimonas altamirensis TaxID=370622 RepID=UPI0025577B1B|nr:hypothetical protein [Aureimonas altamirensis]